MNLLLFSNHVYANDELVAKKSRKPAKEVPTKIRSDIIDIKRKSQTVNFLGNVVIEKADSSLLSQKMTILYEEKKTEKKTEKGDEVTDEKSANTESSKESSIKKIYTDEKVKIFSQDLVATGDSGYYDPAQDVFILEKNVIVNNGVSVAKGDKFVYNITSKKSNFIGEKKEVDNSDRRVVVVIGDDVKDFKKSTKKSHD